MSLSNVSALMTSPCPFCCGASPFVSRGGMHDPACPTVQRLPVTAAKPARERNET